MRQYNFIIILLVAGFLLIKPGCLIAESALDYQSHLDNIRDKIANILTALGQNKSHRSSVRSELRKLEVNIAKTAKKLRKTQNKHKKSSKQLKSILNELKTLSKKLKKQRRMLAAQLRSAYAMGQQPQLKMILNQQNPTEMGRAMVYYSYLNSARGNEIKGFLASIKKEQQLKSQVIKTKQRLAQLLVTKKHEKKHLSKQRSSRKKILAQLDKDIEGQQLTLEDLHSSRNRIEDLLMSLGELLADIPAQAENQRPFAQLKGKLPWPIKGKFRANYGTSRMQGDLRWNGVVISADYDTPVRAVSNGRVAFSDWLQGYGFITIIDHNDGYLSLYGYNQALYKQVGDWVEASEVIASVGDSGGQLHPGLYFEIRKQGVPINPKKWCSTKARHLASFEN